MTQLNALQRAKSRPKNLNLLTIHFPIPAIVSILHRMTGVALFVLMPFLVYCLSLSLHADGFIKLQEWMTTWYFRGFFWLCLIPLYFHLVAGIRHLLMDVHVGDSLQAARTSSYITFFISFILIALTGIWLW